MRDFELTGKPIRRGCPDGTFAWFLGQFPAPARRDVELERSAHAGAKRRGEVKMTLGTRTQLLASAALLGLAASTPALAQAAPAQSTQNQSVTDENSQEIIVTAQKREQVLLKVPQSVTVVGQDTLERQQATSFQDYLSRSEERRVGKECR